MKKLFLAIASVALLFATSCKTPGEGEFIATIVDGTYTSSAPAKDGMSTKTTIDTKKRYVIWQEGDQIAINNSIYTTSSSSKTVIFSPVDAQKPATGQSFHAFYPVSIAGSGATGVMPATQTYEEGKLNNLPMYAYSTDNELSFYHLFAVVTVTVPSNINVSTIDVETTDAKALYGSFDVVSDGNGGYMAKMTQAVDDDHKKVTLICNDILSNKIIFYIAVPAATYDNLTVTITSTEGNKVVREFSGSALSTSGPDYSSSQYDDGGYSIMF